MSVAKRYKNPILNGSQCFAILRALAGRETWLQRQIERGTTNGEAQEHLDYFAEQLADVRSALLVLNGTAFVEG